MMNSVLEDKFSRMGARAKVLETSINTSRNWRSLSRESMLPFLIDVKKDRNGEFFELSVDPNAQGFRLEILDIQPTDRHLLLMAKNKESSRKFLCGHDERSWFSAGVPTKVKNVREAKEALKPAPVAHVEAILGIRSKDKHKHRNSGWIRQGEWFFVPSPIVPNKLMVLKNEPLRRGRNKPHIAEELYREGGTTVRVCSRYPNGLTESQYQTLVKSNPDAKSYPWRVMSRNPTAYVRGRISHSDHKTIVLSTWHLVVPNTEVSSRNNAFLD